MSRSHNSVFIKHSKILFLPVLGTFIYLLQNYLFEKDLLINIKISRRNNKARDKLLESISKKSNNVVVQSPKLSRLLKKINAEIINDFIIEDLKSLNTGKLYDLMWTFVFSDYVSAKTKEPLKNFLYKSFPVKRIIVIPYNHSFDLVADYVLQTAKALTREGNIVYLIAQEESEWIFSFYINNLKNKTKEGVVRHRNFEIVYPLRLFPLRFQKLKIFEKINKVSRILSSTLFVRKVKPDYLWCFDHLDLELASLTKNHTASLYDCVDYFYTLDPVKNKIIQRRETKLIKTVGRFFVNSHSLEKAKKSIRAADMIVPQGFDVNSFQSKDPLSQNEKGEISRVRQLFINIPNPRVGYVGNITYRMDFKLLKKLIKKLTNISFIFTDAFLPIPDDDAFRDTEKHIRQIKSFQNVFLIPKTKSRRVVKEIIKGFDIGIIPYDTSLDFNRYCYPMKLFEYFYMGKPVISTPIDELKRFPKFVKIGESSIDWEKHIKSLISMSWPKVYKKEQKKLAIENSWENKIEAIYNQV